jgi:hypothetical protein
MRLVLLLGALAALQRESAAFSTRFTFGAPFPTNHQRQQKEKAPTILSTMSVTTSASPNDAGTSAVKPTADLTADEKKRQERKSLIRLEGGRFAFDTKFGALNPYAIYYGTVSIALGIPWFIALSFCQLLFAITGGRFDRQRRVPIFLTQIWGTLLLKLTYCCPRIENHGSLLKFYKEYVGFAFLCVSIRP